MRVTPKIGEKVVLSDIGFVAEADDFAEADALPFGVVQHGCAQRPALADKGDVAMRRHLFGKGRIEAHGGIRVDDAQTVRPHKGDPVAVGDIRQLLFQRRTFRTRLFETRRDDDNTFDPLLPALLQHLRDKGCPHDDDGEVNRVGNVQHCRIRPHPAHGSCVRVDRVNDACEPTLQQVLQNGVTDAVFPARRTDDGDRLRFQDGAQIPNAADR
ncbi:hypothetical protein HRbin17_00397 [bacterium HR17]|uniref:Uncharacterized protein n=1 Tax=Candidatus Fervidibacter japonicus TaxID=2035412 RepID=A0A2H5X9N5_9BACT|nr:hypothetical protein HRbin17_00397 [bacterium HR17]